jgi:hypothetical protein
MRARAAFFVLVAVFFVFCGAPLAAEEEPRTLVIFVADFDSSGISEADLKEYVDYLAADLERSLVRQVQASGPYTEGRVIRGPSSEQASSAQAAAREGAQVLLVSGALKKTPKRYAVVVHVANRATGSHTATLEHAYRDEQELYSGCAELARDLALACVGGQPIRSFVQDDHRGEASPYLWTIATPFQCLTLIAAIPFGNFGSYFRSHYGISLDEPVSYKNIVITPSISLTLGSIKTPFFYEGEEWKDEFSALTFDLSLGYRFKLLPKLDIVPQCTLGLLSVYRLVPGIPADSRVRVGFTPVASAGLILEYYFKFPGYPLNFRVTAGIGYRAIINYWENRFGGSELLLWMGLVGFWIK